MNEVLNKPELISAIQSGGLGIVIGIVFAIFGFRPPSPDNLAGIMGIIGIFVGWMSGGYFFK